MLSHNDLVKKMLENPSVKKEYDALEIYLKKRLRNVWALNKLLLPDSKHRAVKLNTRLALLPYIVTLRLSVAT